MIQVTSFTDFRKNLRQYFEKVYDMGKPLVISRPKGKDIVVMSKSEYDGMQETFHLLKSPRNAERLLKSIEAEKAGKVTVRNLIE